jgi:hypothetical protein
MRKQAIKTLAMRYRPSRSPGQVYFLYGGELFRLDDPWMKTPLNFDEINDTDGPLVKETCHGVKLDRAGGLPRNIKELALLIRLIYDPSGSPPVDGSDTELRTVFEDAEFYRGKPQ